MRPSSRRARILGGALAALVAAPASAAAQDALAVAKLSLVESKVELSKKGATWQAAVEGGVAGLYDVFTAPEARGRGLARALCIELLRIAHCAGLVVEFVRRRVERAAAGQPRLARPADQVLEHRAQAGQALRLPQRGAEHGGQKTLFRRAHDGQLHFLLGTEMSEQAALRHAGAVGQPADRKRADADLAGQRQGLVEDCLPGFFTFAHGRFIERSFVLVNPS